MSALLEQLKDAATALSIPERAELASHLLVTLEPSEEGVAEAWRSELLRRVTEISTGQTPGIPAEQVLSRMREKYP